LAFSASAVADVAVDFVSVDNSAAPQLAGFVTQDIQVLTTNDWSSSGMVLNLTSGSVYQDASPTAGDTAPASSMFASFPSLAFDTYVGEVDGQPPDFIAGGAGDIGGTALRFDTQALDVTWFNTPLGFSSVGTEFGISTIGRVSLSNDAQGTLAFSISEADKQLATYEFPVIDGHIVPDPCYGLPGDVACGINIIGIDELNNVLTYWNQNVTKGDTTSGDYDHDGFVGIGDLNVILSFWNAGSGLLQMPDLYYDHFPDAEPFGDGFVGIADLNIVLGEWNYAVTPGALADYSGDGFIGQDDLNAVLSNWNAGTPPSVALPEPGSAALFAGAGVWLLRRFKR
jgi:hypothetical protein